jgi:hypothetical protein
MRFNRCVRIRGKQPALLQNILPRELGRAARRPRRDNGFDRGGLNFVNAIGAPSKPDRQRRDSRTGSGPSERRLSSPKSRY